MILRLFSLASTRTFAAILTSSCFPGRLGPEMSARALCLFTFFRRQVDQGAKLRLMVGPQLLTICQQLAGVRTFFW